eukprot:3813602-Pyramimonas_sp.AAC.1
MPAPRSAALEILEEVVTTSLSEALGVCDSGDHCSGAAPPGCALGGSAGVDYGWVLPSTWGDA